jgi:hypothetical protein
MAPRPNDRHVGSDFDDFLREEGLLEEVEAVAHRVVAERASGVVHEQQGEERLIDSSDLLQYSVLGCMSG